MFISSFNTLFSISFFFFNDPATTEIYTLSLHDALPISRQSRIYGQILCLSFMDLPVYGEAFLLFPPLNGAQDRKSTRLNSSHGYISYAVFCLNKKTRTPCCAS